MKIDLSILLNACLYLGDSCNISSFIFWSSKMVALLLCYHSVAPCAGGSELSTGSLYAPFIHCVSHFNVETYCFANGLCLFKQSWSVIYHWNQCDALGVRSKSGQPPPPQFFFVFIDHKFIYANPVKLFRRVMQHFRHFSPVL